MYVPDSPEPLHIDPKILHLRRIAPIIVQVDAALERRDRVHQVVQYGRVILLQLTLMIVQFL